ncbi:MAG: hypothetical protein KAQ89_02510 [Planctomycetes bacterium]|nr:hypothetical protein [Planctomycetota bacterium]
MVGRHREYALLFKASMRNTRILPIFLVLLSGKNCLASNDSGINLAELSQGLDSVWVLLGAFVVASMAIVFKLIQCQWLCYGYSMLFARQGCAGLVKPVKKLSAKCQN